MMELSFENKSEKDLVAIAGLLQILDKEENIIKEIKVPLEEKITAGKTKKWSGDLPFNPENEKDSKLAESKLEEIKTVWIPNTYTFSDGTYMNSGL